MNYPAMVTGNTCIYLHSIDYILLNPILLLCYSYAIHMRLSLMQLNLFATAYIIYSSNMLIVYRLSEYQTAVLSMQHTTPLQTDRCILLASIYAKRICKYLFIQLSFVNADALFILYIHLILSHKFDS